MEDKLPVLQYEESQERRFYLVPVASIGKGRRWVSISLR